MPRIDEFELAPLERLAYTCLANIRDGQNGLQSVKADTIIRKLKNKYFCWRFEKW